MKSLVETKLFSSKLILKSLTIGRESIKLNVESAVQPDVRFEKMVTE